MDVGPPSDKLAEYLNDVQRRTGRSISVSPDDGATEADSPRAYLHLGPGVSAIEIRFRPLRPLSHPSTEKQVAHELTHAVMIYSEGFEIPCAPQDVSQHDVQTATEIVDLVDDVIVDVRISRLGFAILTQDGLSLYESLVATLEAATSRAQIETYEHDPIRAEINLVAHYIYAWAIPRYVDLRAPGKGLFSRFTRRFPQVLKAEFGKAQVIKKLVMANDILSLQGRTTVVVGASDLWPIHPSIYLSRISAG